MRCLIDMQILIWAFAESDKLSTTATNIIKDRSNSLYVSMGSFWETAIKINIGKLSLQFEVEVLFQEAISNDIEIMEIEMQHILRYVKLPIHHRDPFDRLIISQAIVERLPVISSDEKFSLYDIHRIW